MENTMENTCQPDNSKLNRDRIIQLANHLEQIGDEFFSMEDYEAMSGCELTHCIGGLAIILFTEDGFSKFSIFDRAMSLLGLDYRQAGCLFLPDPIRDTDNEKNQPFYYRAVPGQPGYITRKHAIACLRNLAETGEVDWVGTK